MEPTGRSLPPFGNDPMALGVLEALPAQVCLLDAEGGIVAVNGLWEQSLRENGGELSRCGPGVNYLEVCRAAGERGSLVAAEAAQGVADVLARRRESFSLEYVTRVADRSRWFLLLAAPLRSEDGGAIVSHLDITGRKVAEMALHESEFRLRSVIDTAADGIITVDCAGTIDTFNAAAERIYGYDRSEVIGKNVSILMPSLAQTAGEARLEHLADQGAGLVHQVMAVREDGLPLPVELSIGRVDSLDLYTAIVRDISERRAMQEQLLTIAEQEQRRIGQDLHDGVGQELTGLGLMIESLVEAMEQGESPEETLADRIRSALRRTQEGMRDICRGLLPVEVDAEGLMAALNDLAARFNANHGVTCRFECRETVRIEDNWTGTHLYRIAQEAVSNAVRHGHAQRIVICLHQNHGVLALEISDNGSGMPDGIETSRKGMGLQIMRYRASLIGANLQFESVEGGGVRVICAIKGRDDHDDRSDVDWDRRATGPGTDR